MKESDKKQIIKRCEKWYNCETEANRVNLILFYDSLSTTDRTEADKIISQMMPIWDGH